MTLRNAVYIRVSCQMSVSGNTFRTPFWAVFADLTQHKILQAWQGVGAGQGVGVVRHSMGARVAIEMARQAPQRVDAMVLANTGHAPLQPGEMAKREAKIQQGHADMTALAARWLPPMLAPGRRRTPL